jgi:hypothetical protein
VRLIHIYDIQQKEKNQSFVSSLQQGQQQQQFVFSQVANSNTQKGQQFIVTQTNSDFFCSRDREELVPYKFLIVEASTEIGAATGLNLTGLPTVELLELSKGKGLPITAGSNSAT